MAQPATGASALFGIRRELSPGVPDTTQTRVFYKIVPPLGADLVRTLQPSPEIDAQGFPQRGIPGPVTGPLDLAAMLTASSILEPLESALGGADTLTKTEPETDVFQYDGEPVRGNEPTTFDAIFSTDPVDIVQLRELGFSSLNIAIGNNNPLPLRLAGFVSHGTHLSAITQATGTGTYTEGPALRGNLRRPRVGEKVYFKTSVDTTPGPHAYIAERVPSGGTPGYVATAVASSYDADLNGDWGPVTGAYQLTGTVTVSPGGTAYTGTGTKFLDELEVDQRLTLAGEVVTISAIGSNTAFTASAHTAGATTQPAYLNDVDFGWWDENRDPLEVIYPGTLTQQGDLATNDVHTADADWDPPSATYMSGQRFTSAHLFLDWRRQGASSWIPFQVLTGQVVIPWVLTPGQGSGSRYYQDLSRDTTFSPTLTFTRKFTDRAFQELSEGHEPFEVRLRWLGGKLKNGTSAYRESITLTGTAAEIMSRTRPVAGPAAIVETVNIAFKASEDGDAPLTFIVITDRDYTVAA
jgi:hypothetical protein